MAQDPKTAKYASMPQAAIDSQCVDIVTDAADLGDQLAEVLAFFQGMTERQPAQPEKSRLMGILSVIKEKWNVDFTDYNQSIVNRRIQHCVNAREVTDIDEYCHLLVNDTEEVAKLVSDILIGDTQFFRAPGAFDGLKITLLPLIDEALDHQQSFRVWVPACSTGEEVYSLVIMLMEMGIGNINELTVFATDLNAVSINTARTGIYPSSISQHIPAAYLEKYFDQEAETYKVKRFIREMITFSVHDVSNDPPFAKLDLISCRNVLTYFNNELQQKMLSSSVLINESLSVLAEHFFSKNELDDLLAAARDKNHRLKITGMLLYISGGFVQVLEGEKSVVENLLKEIKADNRHHNLEVIVGQSIISRDFPYWDMACKYLEQKDLVQYRLIAKLVNDPQAIEQSDVVSAFLALIMKSAK